MYKRLEDIAAYHRYPNVLNRDFIATKSNQKSVTDVTYIRTLQGCAYLSTIIDEYIYFYNHERIQLKTRQTPYETRCLSS